MKYLTLAVVIFTILPLNALKAQDFSIMPIGLFSAGTMELWQSKSFLGETTYTLSSIENSIALKAESHASASGLYKEQRVDLHKTPFLNWRWRVNKPLVDLPEQSKLGDDFSARIYIVVSGGWMFWKTKAINYVWAGNSIKGKTWPNAFVGKQAMMVALRSNSDSNHTWYQEKRNIKADFKSLFGADIQYIDVIALMTDTDNSKSSSIAYYGDIYFSAQ